MTTPKPVSLTVTDNGPIKVSADDLSLRFCGEAVEVEPGQDVYLCRCGETDNPPFCDGSHGRTGFVAEPRSGDAKEVRVWEGRTLRTFFNPTACMHALYCKPLKELRERELAGDDAAAAEIARVVMSCPSGALTYESTEAIESPDTEQAKIDIIEGGEIRIQCEFEINAERHERQPADRATLCRCGLSENKPWCDGKHRKREGFR